MTSLRNLIKINSVVQKLLGENTTVGEAACSSHKPYSFLFRESRLNAKAVPLHAMKALRGEEI
jgi:hypothetical protein